MGRLYKKPSLEVWLEEAKKEKDADQCGMYLAHNGVVRKTAKAKVRQGDDQAPDVTELFFDYDEDKVNQAIARVKDMPGIYYAKAWLNTGVLEVGEDMMLLLVGGDIRPHVADALQSLLEEIKTKCVIETEKYVGN